VQVGIKIKENIEILMVKHLNYLSGPNHVFYSKHVFSKVTDVLMQLDIYKLSQFHIDLSNYHEDIHVNLREK
jgi:hypothetical protein